MTLARLLRPLALLVALGLSAATAHAQEPAPAEGGESEGNPVPGYVATGMLAGLTIFVLCKSARR
jgi:hypothetical protein